MVVLTDHSKRPQVYVFATTAGARPLPNYGLSTYNLRDPCGVTAAHGTCPGGCALTGASSSSDPSVTITGLDPNQQYMVSVVASCNAFWCMPPGVQSQSIAYYPVAPQPGMPSASPSPGPNGPGGGGSGGSSLGSIAVVGGVIAAVVVVLGGAAGGFIYCRRRAGASSKYSAPSSPGTPVVVLNNVLSAVGLGSSTPGASRDVMAYSSSVLGPEGEISTVDMGAGYAYTDLAE